MNKKLIWLSAAAISLLLGQTSFAASTEQQTSKHPHHHSHHHDQFNKIMAKLNLSEDQKAKIHTIKTQNQSQMHAARMQMRAIKMEMSTLIHSDKMDEHKLDALIAKRTQLKASMIKSVAVMRNQIYNILNPQQKTQLQEMRKEWMAKHQQAVM